MKHFNNAECRLARINSFMYAIEGAIIEAQEGGEQEFKYLSALFYILMDEMQMLQADMKEISGNIRVCNAIYAINQVDKLKSEIASLKNK